MKHKKSALIRSFISLLLCFSMLLGTTFAWFTDSVTTGINMIAAGNLDVELYHTNAAVTAEQVQPESDLFLDLNGDPILWEPGVVSYENLRIVNAGNLALAYHMAINTAGENFVIDPEDGSLNGLSDILKVGLVEGGITAADREGVVASVDEWTTLSEFVTNGSLLPEGKGESEQTWGVVIYWEPGENDNLWNLNNGKELSDGETLLIDLGIKLTATQEEYESDSFGTDYDTTAKTDVFPEVTLKGSATAKVNVDENGVVTKDKKMKSGQVRALIPAGVKVADGVSKLTMTVTELDESEANITLGEGEAMRSLDVHIDGIAADNAVAMIIDLGVVLPAGLNMGNYKLYHVENGASVAMTYVADEADLDEHNEFFYDPEDGRVVIALQNFSEVAMIAEPAKWEGNFDYSWYTNANARTVVIDYVIANADQLAAFGAIVGGMDGQTQDSFSGKYVKLIADINLGDKESENNPDLIFYPIGYYNSEGTYERTNTAITSGLRNFEGTFDGNGHTIANFYQNTWEMKGDHDWYSPEEQYYRDGMGLFGKVYGGTVKNLTVKNFSSDGEIATTGVIAAYADFGATFENISIFNCNPRVYNIGNGGIVGCVGWYTAGVTDKKVTFKNITVDNSNKISALWGSYDVACGGIVGQYYPTSGQTSAGTPKNGGIHFENCHISAIMDVYNDVCANYQYYAYRYTGMLIGSVRENVTENGHSYPKMDGITATGCTVHFGTWNDYYYCEIIDNTTASYTHDYQMSRLTEIKEIDGTTITYLDGTTGTVPASGRANYVIVDYTKGHGTENATCYHFKDGAVWTHDMGGIQEGIDENGDGQDDLKEDKQHIYLEFNNLVTGYGWGVTSKGVGDLAGVTILDREEGNSVVKFEKAETAEESYVSGSTVSVRDLFAVVQNSGVEINGEAVQVAVSPDGEGSTAGGTYVANTTDWTKGTLTFTGAGAAFVSITDYNFCKTTSINVTIVGADKFEAAFDHDPDTEVRENHVDDYLYRVGNANAVKLSSLFAVKESQDVNTDITNVSVEIESVVDGANVKGIYTPNATWTDGTIQFFGTGPVNVTIKADGAKDYTLPLEVVNATNFSATNISSLGSGSVVLLCDTKLNANGALALQNASLFGNGFELDVSAGRVNGESVTANYLLYLNNGVLDNVEIIGAVYTEFSSVSSQAYNNPTVLAIGNSSILNCTISNCASPVRVRSGNIKIENTVLKGGNFANLDIRGGNVVLKDVTTINQADMNDNAGVIGLGVVVYYEGPSSETKLTIQGDLKQYNNIAENTSMSNSYASAFLKEMFKSDYSSYHRTDANGVKWGNTGVLSLHGEVGEDNIIVKDHKNKDSYLGSSLQFDHPTLGDTNGYLYSVKGDSPVSGADSKDPAQGVIVPKVSFDHDVNKYIKQDGDETSCTSDPLTDAETITFAQGGSFAWNVKILKSDREVTYTVWMDGTQYDNQIVFEDSGEHTIVFKYEDANNYRLNSDGKVEKYSIKYETSMKVIVMEQEVAAKNAEITFPMLSSYGTTKVTVGDKTYVMPNLTGVSVPKYGDDLTFDAGTRKYGSLKSDGKTSVDIYYPIIKTAISGNYMVFPVFGNKNGELVQIQDYADKGVGDALTAYNTKTQALPAGLSVSRGYTVQWSTDKNVVGSGSMNYGSWTNGVLAFKYQSSSDDIALKMMNNYLSYYPNINLRSNDRNEQVMVAEYKYVDNKGDTFYYCVGYHIEERNSGYAFGETVPEGISCVTSDTLVTLADGSQKRIDELTYVDELLVWDFYNGEYTTAPISIIYAHEEMVQPVLHLNFSDGTTVKVISSHGFFDTAVNNFVYISESNVEEFIGHKFVKANGTNYAEVTLRSYDVVDEMTTAYWVQTAVHNNAVTEGILSITTPDYEGWFDYFNINDDMKYDEKHMQEEIAKYGLTSYDELSYLGSYETYVALNAQYLNILIGRGVVTMEEILELFELYA